MTFLKAILKDRTVDAVEIYREARKQGISDRTLRRAKKDLGVLAVHAGAPGGKQSWTWRLPDQKESPKAATTSIDRDVVLLGKSECLSADKQSTSPKAATTDNRKENGHLGKQVNLFPDPARPDVTDLEFESRSAADLAGMWEAL